MDRIVLFGNGQFVQNAYYHFSRHPDFQVVAFTVDRSYLREPELFGLPVVAFEQVQEIYPPDEYQMHVSISYRKVNRLRAEKFDQAKAKGYRLASLINPRANVWDGLMLGENVLIGGNCLIDAYVELGHDVHIAGGCLVGHHTSIGDHAFLAAGAVVSGSVTVEPYCFLGAGCVLRDRLKIARSTVVGAGAVILEDTVEKGVYLGRAAERLPILSDQLPTA